jgi:hypothetical protein
MVKCGVLKFSQSYVSIENTFNGIGSSYNSQTSFVSSRFNILYILNSSFIKNPLIFPKS